MTDTYDDARRVFKKALRLAKASGGDLFVCGLDLKGDKSASFALTSPLALICYAHCLLQGLADKAPPADPAVEAALCEALAAMGVLAAALGQWTTATIDAEGRGNVH